MKNIILLILLVSSFSTWGQSSMRRCTLLPVTDSVGGAIGFRVFEQVEEKLKQSNWCTYVSNSGMINVFSKYRDNLAQFLKTKEVLATVSEKLKVGSIIRVGIINEVKGVEIQMEIYGENGEDIFFSEKALLMKDDIDLISASAFNWLDMYSKMIPYDAKVNGILGEQLTLDVGKGYPIHEGQKFLVKRLTSKKKHPLLKKIVDWETEVLAEGKIFSISDNQALGMVKNYKQEKKISAGDWVRLEEMKEEVVPDKKMDDTTDQTLGTLGVLSVSLLGSGLSVDSTTPSGSNSMYGRLYGINARAEGWITRQYFAAFEILKSIGTIKKKSGTPEKDSVGVNTGSYKISGGYRYLPIGFFYGPQIDLYGGLGYHSYDLDYSVNDGYGKSNFKGILVGTNVNLPINREFRFTAGAEFMPFPSFKDEENNFQSAKNVSAMELRIGLKYQYTVRVSIDVGLESHYRKAKFNDSYKEISYGENMLKLGTSFNF